VEEIFMMVRIPFASAIVFALASFAAASADETKFMSLDEISKTVIGNTMTGKTAKGDPYTEYYAADGSIHGLAADGSKYAGKWWLRKEDSLMCFRYGDGAFDAGCVRLSLMGDRVGFTLMDGTTEPSATLVQGNPSSL
jgi:hypothetical protein